jgi:N-acetylglucosamine-6-phosphate deacetylase
MTMRMRSAFIPLLAGLICLAGFAPLSAEPLTVFTGVRLIDGSGEAPIENATLIVENGRIVAAGRVDPAAYSGPRAQSVSCAGQTIMPALISDHSHVGMVKDGKVSPENYTAENVEAALRQYEGYGETKICFIPCARSNGMESSPERMFSRPTTVWA